MEKKSFKVFNQEVTWSTKFFVLLVVVTVALSIYLDAWNGYWYPTILGAIAIVSFVDILGIYGSRHPGFLKSLGWILLVLLLFVILSGSFF